MTCALGIILVRSGSKGLPNKCLRPLQGRPVLSYTLNHARASKLLDGVVLSSDSGAARELALNAGIEVIVRPAELATDESTVDASARHAVIAWERRHDREVSEVALLYGNIPLRADGIIDRAIEHRRRTGADSVRTVAPVTKQHPDWIHRLNGDRMTQFRPNGLYRRQDLEPLYYHDGAAVVVTRSALFDALRYPQDGQAFLGSDRRAIIQRVDEAVDIDDLVDLLLAETMLRSRTENDERH